MTSQDNSTPRQQAQANSPASIFERSMQEAKRIRMDALAAAERQHAAMTVATQTKCDEMLAAAQRQADAIVEAARFEAERVRAEVATESRAGGEGIGQSSAQVILEMALTEAQQMLTKATEEAERIREYLVADAQATAMETIRQAEVQAAALLQQTALQLDVVREQARQIYERLTDVTRDLQPPVPSGTAAVEATPTTSAPVTVAEPVLAENTPPQLVALPAEVNGDDGETESEGETTEAAESVEPDTEDEDELAAELPSTPVETSKPVWAIDLRSLSAKPPRDRSGDEPTNQLFHERDEEVAGQPVPEAPDVSSEEAASTEQTELQPSPRVEPMAELPAHVGRSEPEATQTQPRHTGTERVFALQERVRTSGVVDANADASANGIKRMLGRY